MHIFTGLSRSESDQKVVTKLCSDKFLKNADRCLVSHPIIGDIAKISRFLSTARHNLLL